MKILRHIVSLLFVIACMYQPHAHAKIIGNKTAVFIIPTSPIFPAGDTDNTMLGFGYFKGGFTLQDATTSCTFSSAFPVSGIVNMNGGTLYLLEDFVLTETVELQGLGTIIGNEHSMEFSESITSLPSNFTLIKDLNLYFKHDVDLNSTVTIQGQCSINFSGNKLTFNNGSGLVIDHNAHLEIQATLLQGIGAERIRCINDTGSLRLNSVTAALNENGIFAHGSINIQNLSSLIGPYSFTYASSAPMTIEENSALLLDGGSEFVFGKSTMSSQEPLILADATSKLECLQCTLHITGSGAQLTKGILSFNGNSIIESDSSDPLYGFIWGDNSSASNDLQIVFGPGSYTSIIAGALTYNNVNSDGFANSVPSSTLSLSTTITFVTNTNCDLPGNTFLIEGFGITFPQILIAPGKNLTYNNTQISIPGYGDAVYKMYFTYPYFTNLSFLDTNDYIYLSSGTPVGIAVLNSGNIIQGTGIVINNLILTSPLASVQLGILGLINAPIDLNGGTITLLNDTTMSSPDFLSTGIIDLGTNTLIRTLPAGSSIFATPTLFMGTRGIISLGQDCTLSCTWTFSGNVVIDANSNTINFAGGTLLVAPNSSLTIRNAHLTDIAPNSIYCADDTGSITLYDTTWTQADNFTFATGALNYKGTVLMSGPNFQFTYESTATSNFSSNTNLELDNLFTFSYAPSNNSTTLLEFTDFSSKFSLNHSVLYISPGLHVTKGQMTLQQGPTIYALGDGLTLGDMTISDSSADMQVTFLDPTSTTLIGTLKYQNNLLSSWQMWTSAVLSFTDEIPLYVYRTIKLNKGATEFTYTSGTPSYYYYATACPIASDLDGTKYGAPTPIDMC